MVYEWSGGCFGCTTVLHWANSSGFDLSSYSPLLPPSLTVSLLLSFSPFFHRVITPLRSTPPLPPPPSPTHHHTYPHTPSHPPTRAYPPNSAKLTTIRNCGPGFALNVIVKCVRAFLFRRRIAIARKRRQEYHEARRQTSRRRAVLLFPAPQWTFARFLRFLHKQLADTARALAAITASSGGGVGGRPASRSDRTDAVTVATSLQEQHRRRRSTMPMPLASVLQAQQQQRQLELQHHQQRLVEASRTGGVGVSGGSSGGGGGGSGGDAGARRPSVMFNGYRSVILQTRHIAETLGFGASGASMTAARATAARAAQSKTLWLTFQEEVRRSDAPLRYALDVGQQHQQQHRQQNRQRTATSDADGAFRGEEPGARPSRGERQENDGGDSSYREHHRSRSVSTSIKRNGGSTGGSTGGGGIASGFARLFGRRGRDTRQRDAVGETAESAHSPAHTADGPPSSEVKRRSRSQGIIGRLLHRRSKADAALTIQRVWRGTLVRRRLAEKKRIWSEVAVSAAWQQYVLLPWVFPVIHTLVAMTSDECCCNGVAFHWHGWCGCKPPVDADAHWLRSTCKLRGRATSRACGMPSCVSWSASSSSSGAFATSCCGDGSWALYGFTLPCDGSKAAGACTSSTANTGTCGSDAHAAKLAPSRAGAAILPHPGYPRAAGPSHRDVGCPPFWLCTTPCGRSR